jgi:hypothetical protein
MALQNRAASSGDLFAFRLEASQDAEIVGNIITAIAVSITRARGLLLRRSV